MVNMSRRSKMLENRMIQHNVEIAHKTRLRETIIPYLRAKRKDLRIKASNHRIRIQSCWRKRLVSAKLHLLDAKRKHRATVTQHKMRLAEIRSR